MTSTPLPATAAEQYAARIDAVLAQRARLRGSAEAETWTDGAPLDAFRADPHRPLDPSLELIAAYLEPDDVLIDVGGGAGRISLPLALRCREVINVDSSPVMLRACTDSARDAGITNARAVAAEWPDLPQIGRAHV
jgi:2-polyprenyl-3-methyl-5-hydroxy-6-metoxy-1,4-benzoquinol methylase